MLVNLSWPPAVHLPAEKKGSGKFQGILSTFCELLVKSGPEAREGVYRSAQPRSPPLPFLGCQAKRAPRAAFPGACLAAQTKRWVQL